MHWRKISLIGVGLLGGSLGLAIKKRKLAEQVQGYVRRHSLQKECEQLGAVDAATLNLSEAVEGADLIILCTPIAQMAELAQDMARSLKMDAIVTDVGSVKATVVRELEPIFGSVGGGFIGSHPMAGAEKSGVAAARADLFEGAVCVVAPTANTSPRALAQAEQFWTALGSSILRMSPELHDELVCRSSHLPHVLAAELANYVLNPTYPKEQALLCANGFRDTTRIASGSPKMWRDIALANRENLRRALGTFMDQLKEFQHALDQADAEAITRFFESAKQRRDQWRGGSTSPE